MISFKIKTVKCKRSIMKAVMIIVLMMINQAIFAQNSQQTAQNKIADLQKLIKGAEAKKLDANKEKMTAHTAQLFLKYANWDEAHLQENEKLFKMVRSYKDRSSEFAAQLSGFERSEVNLMLDQAIKNIKELIAGEIIRKPMPTIDWSKVTLNGNELYFNKNPVFLSDYTWKPHVKELTKYYGDLDGFLLTPSDVTNENGDIKASVLDKLKAKPDGTAGFIFLNHKTVPKWALDKYPNLNVGQTNYTAYDIDNPGAREMQSLLLKGTVPYMAGKKYTELGYMLCNEPHWNTIAKSWSVCEISDYTRSKFKNWLKTKHASIADLNHLWHTNFSSFDDVSLEVPINQNLQGTPQWYDWIDFNMYRVTDWFTFLHDEIQKYDPKAKTHIKVMPNLWSDNKRDNGLDMEKLVKLTEIIGNDASSGNSHMWGPEEDWENDYCMNWRELCMSYDFFKSISPEKIIFNTETHYLSTTRSRDLHLSPAYARASYWLATTQGMNANQTWFWARNADGSIMSKGGKGYAGSNNQQPRIVNEVASTMMDLNAYSQDIAALQNLKKPIRIFYSKTSAIDKPNHMDDVYDLYKSLFFDGIPLGFATSGIITEQNNKDWEVILVRKTPFVTVQEFTSLQDYLNNGGTVIMDEESLKKNEYGQPLNTSLQAGKGKLILANTLKEMDNKAMGILATKNLLPSLNITETNALNVKGCTWKYTTNKDGHIILSVVNLGKTNASLDIQLKGAKNGTLCKDLLKGIYTTSKPILKPNDVYFVEIRDGKNISH